MALTKPQGDMVMKLGTEQASTSGTAIDFTGIPAGTTMIVVNLFGVSTNGSSNLLLQLGDSGGVETTGYESVSAYLQNATALTVASATSGLLLTGAMAAAETLHGQIVLCLEDQTGFAWTAQGKFTDVSSTVNLNVVAGAKALSAVLDRVRITSASADTFDSGAINISYF